MTSASFLKTYNKVQQLHDAHHLDGNEPDIRCDICWERWSEGGFDWPNGETSIYEVNGTKEEMLEEFFKFL